MSSPKNLETSDNLYKVIEWFKVPFDEIEKVINLVITGDI